MGDFSAHNVTGQMFELARTDARHYAGRNDAAATQAGNGGAETDFGRMLFDSLDNVNDMQQTHENLSVQSIVNPDSVDPHDVTVAAAKANLSLSITKSVVDRVLQAYREITNLR
jgi:flagellar hook-basal body complex protein FliE